MRRFVLFQTSQSHTSSHSMEFRDREGTEEAGSWCNQHARLNVSENGYDYVDSLFVSFETLQILRYVTCLHRIIVSLFSLLLVNVLQFFCNPVSPILKVISVVYL